MINIFIGELVTMKYAAPKFLSLMLSLTVKLW